MTQAQTRTQVTLGQAQRSPDPEIQETLERDPAEAKERTPGAIEQIAAADARERRNLTGEETRALSTAIAALEGPVITPADAILMTDPAGDWFDLELTQEGIGNHILYHLGQPGECGSGCPAFSQLRILPE